MECENPECANQKSLRRFLHRSASEGVLVQGRWYCSLDCFERGITQEFSALLATPDEPLHRLHRVPLGLLLLGRGVITDEQLKRALASQRRTGGERLGRHLVNQGVASARDVAAALAVQWGCGVFPIESNRRYLDCYRMLPFSLLETARMMPVHYQDDSQQLFVAFAEDIDHTALYSVERLLRTRTEPCVVTESAMEQALEETRTLDRPAELVFDTIWGAAEIARTVRDYALALGVEELRLARPRRFLWIRLHAPAQSYDMLFRLPPRPGE